MILALSVLAYGCKLPSQPVPPEISPDAVYTIAAQTVIAQYTQNAFETPPENEAPSETPIPSLLEPTQIEEPTSTEEPTATPTPTETATPTEIPDLILEDDFSNTNLWYVYTDDDYGFEYKDGGYRIHNEILNATIYSVRYLNYKDIRLEVDAIPNDGPGDGYYGILCRFGNDGEEYYGLVIGANGFYGILKMENNESEFLASGIDEDEIIQRGLGKTNRVRGVCSGEKLTLYANGKLLLEVMDDSLTKGDVGLLVGNQMSGVGMDVLFDNFAVIWP